MDNVSFCTCGAVKRYKALIAGMDRSSVILAQEEARAEEFEAQGNGQTPQDLGYCCHYDALCFHIAQLGG